jgi:pimeloyl-ACP methyl ester carboxylesterase
MLKSGFIKIRGVHLEYQWLGPQPGSRPILVFLHEGLGCVSLWNDFPERLVSQTGLSAFVYSRAGYGKSDPFPLPRPTRFMHDEAEVLAQVLSMTRVKEIILVGHSDGASIAMIYAGVNNASGIQGLILEAPHVFTEPSGLESIARIAEVYRTSDLRERLAKHHGSNTDIAFWGWNDVWLNPEFRSWNIETFLPAIQSPILILQGEEDEYGTLRQAETIQRQAGGPVDVFTIPNCGHAPHREHPDLTMQVMTEFIRKILNT